jgi:hypothetical protein
MIWSGNAELNRHRGIMIMSWLHGTGIFRGRDARGGKASVKE